MARRQVTAVLTVEQEWARFRAESEWLGGHTVAEVLAFADRMSDLEDAQRVSGSRHANVISAGPREPRFSEWLRRRFGR
jgi:hypothetical protein